MIVFSLVDYRSAEKTWRYILHVEEVFSESELHFVIVDNSCDTKNYDTLCSKIDVYKTECIEEKKVVIGATTAGNTVQIVDNQENAGYAKGNNLGYKVANKTTAFSYFVVSNNDLRIKNTKINEKDLDQIFKKDMSIGLIGPEIVDVKGNRQSPCKKQSLAERWIIPMLCYPFDRFFTRYKKTEIDDIENGLAYYINGSFMIFKKDVFEKIKGFDEATFLFAEEPIIAERLLAKGIKTYYTSDISILHEHSTIIKSTYDNLRIIKLRYSSDRYYYKTYCNVNSYVLWLSDLLVKTFNIKYRAIQLIKGIVLRRN